MPAGRYTITSTAAATASTIAGLGRHTEDTMIAQALDHLFYGATPADLACFVAIAIGLMLTADQLVASLRDD